MITNAIYSKLLSESLLSLYPSIVKKIDLSIFIQMITRLITYVLISLFFINYSFITNNLFKQESIILSLINFVHIYTSYEAFKNLDSGISFSIFNIYPLLILLFSGVMWDSVYIFSICGLLLFIYENYSSNKDINNPKVNFSYGIFMILISAITEAIIYFLIKKIPTDNSWNHLFISYFWAVIIIIIYGFFDYSKIVILNNIKFNWFLVIVSLLLNAIIGTIGYYLRFFSIYRSDPQTYSLLSFFGVIMAYLYGIFLNNEKINIIKIIATFLIIWSNYIIM